MCRPVHVSVLPFTFLLACVAAACAHPSKPPAPPALKPGAHSSIAAVLEHAAELGLTEDQQARLTERDGVLLQKQSALRLEMSALEQARQKAPLDRGESFDEFAGRRGRRPETGARPRHREDPRAALERRLEEADTEAYLDAEGLLTEPQKAAARRWAGVYREQFFNWQRAQRAGGTR